MRTLINTEGLSPELALCAQLLVYAAVHSHAAQERTSAEIKDAMEVFFTKEQIRMALRFVKDKRKAGYEP